MNESTIYVTLEMALRDLFYNRWMVDRCCCYCCCCVVVVVVSGVAVVVLLYYLLEMHNGTYQYY